MGPVLDDDGSILQWKIHDRHTNLVLRQIPLMTKQLASGRHPDILPDRDQVRTGIVDEYAASNPGTFTDVDTPEPMNGRRDVRWKSKGRDDGPKTDPDALDDRPDSPVIIRHKYDYDDGISYTE